MRACRHGVRACGTRFICPRAMRPPRSQSSARLGTQLLPIVYRGHKAGFWQTVWPLIAVSSLSPTPTGPSSCMHLPRGGTSSGTGAADMPPSSVQLGVHHRRALGPLQPRIERIASPWTPPTLHLDAWPGLVPQKRRYQAKTPESQPRAARRKVGGGNFW